MAKPETSVSVDIETNGPVPGPCSTLSFAATEFGPDDAVDQDHLFIAVLRDAQK